MNTWRILLISLCAAALAGCVRPTPAPVIQPVIIMLPTATPLPIIPTVPPLPNFPTPTPLPDFSQPKRLAKYPGLEAQSRLDFEAVLQSGAWQKYALGPTSDQTGYVVDITPLEPSVDGANIEHKVLPEYDGEVWNDVLWMLLPEQAPPLRVNVHAYLTADWPVAYQNRLQLEPGVWHGFIVCESTHFGGYVVEIDPQGTAPYLAGIERTTVQPEFPGAWLDVLRIQASLNQPLLLVDVRVYRTPDLPVIADFETTLTPGDWTGTVLQPSSARATYVVEVTPLIAADNQIERFVVQPEFDGYTWNDVLRLLVPVDRPPMSVHVRVYVVS